MDTHSECKVRMTTTTNVHQWNWMEGLRHLPTKQDLLVPLELALGFFFILCLELLPVQLNFTPCMVLQHYLCWHTGKGFADDTHYSQSIVDLQQLGGNGLCKTLGAKWFQPNAGGHTEASECIAGVHPLQAYHGLYCTFFVKPVVMDVVLL